MKFIHRVGYYFGGFSLGLIILAFFLQGKKTSCDYGPNARTTKNIATKSKIYTEEVQSIMNQYEMDTLAIYNLIRFGDVDFSRSDTRAEDCKTYVIENTFNQNKFEMHILNCDTVATIQSLIQKK
ncbi:MAG: hypothetical protein R2783_05300 [Gelidibacter sp.]